MKLETVDDIIEHYAKKNDNKREDDENEQTDNSE